MQHPATLATIGKICHGYDAEVFHWKEDLVKGWYVQTYFNLQSINRSFLGSCVVFYVFWFLIKLIKKMTILYIHVTVLLVL